MKEKLIIVIIVLVVVLILVFTTYYLLKFRRSNKLEKRIAQFTKD